MTRPLHLNAFLMGCGHHEAAWRLPDSDPFAHTDLAHWINLAQIAERGTFDSVFLADAPALWGSAKHRPAGALEPTVLLTALAGATSRIGLIATASTTYNDPFNLARRFASLDHVSGGRAGWNIVTTATKNAAQNFGLDDVPGHQERYRRAAEFTDVSIALWDSWEDGAEIGDKATGNYADVSRIHPVDFAGEYFRVRGPLNLPRSPQGRPLLVQAGSSQDGREFAARYAEAVFTAQQTLARHARAGSGHHGGVVGCGGGRRVQRDAARPAVRAGDVRRGSYPDPAQARPVPHRVRRPHPARPLRHPAPGQSVRRRRNP